MTLTYGFEETRNEWIDELNTRARIFRHVATGATAWILAGEPRLAKSIGLKPARRIPLFNGPIECRLLKFELYEGSRKSKSL